MNNNDIIRRLRYTFDLSDDKMIKTFLQGGSEVTRAEISDWLKKDEDPDQVNLYDKQLAAFLNGFIVGRRGKKEGVEMTAEKRLNNNQIFRKLRIALNLKDTDIINVLDKAGYKIGKTELSAFFRKPDHKHFRLCKDQVLRNFIYGLQDTFRPHG